MNQQNTETQSISDDEISLSQIIEFFVDNLRDLLKFVCLGVLLGLSYYLFTVNYVSTITFKNDIATDLASLNRLRQDLNIGATKLDKKKNIYQVVSNEQYWKKNLSPVFALTIDDIKDIKQRQIDEIETNASIPRLQLSLSGFDEETSKRLVEEIFEFLKDEVITIKQRDLYQSYRASVQTEKLSIDKKQSELEKEIEYLRNRARNLEELKIRFPNQQSTSLNQVFDPKDSASKYLPVSTQLVAIYSDLNSSNEQLRRLEDSKEALNIKENIVIAFEKNYKDGNSNVEGLKKLFNLFSEKIADLNKPTGSKLSSKIAIETVLSEINNILTIERLNFEVLDKRTERVTKPLSILIGAFSGLMFGIFFAFALKVKKKYKEEKENRKTLEVKELTNA